MEQLNLKLLKQVSGGMEGTFFGYDSMQFVGGSCIGPAVACFVPASTLFGDKDDLRQQAHDTNYVKDRLKAIASRVAYDYDPSSTTKQRIPIIDGDYPLAKSYDQLIGEYTIDGQKCRGFMVYVPLVR